MLLLAGGGACCGGGCGGGTFMGLMSNGMMGLLEREGVLIIIKSSRLFYGCGSYFAKELQAEASPFFLSIGLTCPLYLLLFFLFKVKPTGKNRCVTRKCHLLFVTSVQEITK